MRNQRISYDEARPDNPRKGVSWISAMTFWYTWKIFQKGSKFGFGEADITKPLPDHQSSILGNKVAKLWSREANRAEVCGEKPSLFKVLFRCFYKEFFIYGLALIVMELIFRIIQPFFIGLFLRYFTKANKENTNPCNHPLYLWRLTNYYYDNQCAITKPEAVVFGIGVIICSFVSVLILHPYMMAGMHLGMKIRIACCSLIYRKVLRISMGSLIGNAAGTVINLLSNDVNRFDIALLFFHYTWIAPLQVLIIMFFMYQEIGVSSFYGIMAVVAVMPIQVYLGHLTSILRQKTARLTDERVRVMNEVIQGVRVIKMYAWEIAFCNLIYKCRRREISALRKTAYIKGLIMSFIMFTSRSGIFFSILSFVLLKMYISTELVFVITTFYMILRQNMGMFFPQGVSQVAEAFVSLKRIGTFLTSEETDVGDPTPIDPNWRTNPTRRKYKRERDMEPERLLAPKGIIIKHAWAHYGTVICLENINLEMVPGQLTACIGQVGAGKTCLLNMILGELKPYDGIAQTNGVVSYASQEPWLFAGSVRQNIIFGQEFDQKRYREVVRVCSLVRDFTLLPYGDRTFIGERGISLSGGQRARVNLARAIYRMADIYLLDDPLSAVDNQVGKFLFDECICNYLKDKVVVLVTHQLQYLQHVQQVVVLDSGKMLGKGTYDSLIQSGLDFAKLLNEIREEDVIVPPEPTPRISQLARSISIAQDTILPPPVEVIGEPKLGSAVTSDIYKQYFFSGGNLFSISLMFGLFFAAQLCASGGDYFLSQWVAMEMQHKPVSLVIANFDLDRQECITVFSIITLCTVIVPILRSFYFFTQSMKCSINLHNRMFTSVIRAQIRFFNVNPSGQILNRFSKDLASVDEFLPYAMIDTYQITLNLVGAVLVLAISEQTLLIPTSVVCILFFIARKYYLTTARGIKRLEGMTRSPIFAHMNATLLGLPTIRSHGQEMILVDEFDRYQDTHSGAWFLFLCTSRAFGYWLDSICALYIALVTLLFLLTDDIFGGKVGLAITQCLGLSGLFQWGMRQSTEMDNHMTSVDRVLQYTKLEQEGALESARSKKPPPQWPSKGEIQFNNVVLRYTPSEPPILKNLNIVINPTEKVGIVGRTGAGKSSLISALFRLAYVEGDIVIDNVGTSAIGLHDLRKKISIIPQEPVLFSGTMRYNLDPFNEYDDFTLVTALRIVEIKSMPTEGIGSLNQPILEGGANYSVGQRQLICLARAIIRKNKILIMDEATANVDPQTDRFIQETIRTKFEACTVLTIAHRLNTVMDSDKILVMDAGRMVEFDHPVRLLDNQQSLFSIMVDKTGPSMSEKLKTIAREAYNNKYGGVATSSAALRTTK